MNAAEKKMRTFKFVTTKFYLYLIFWQFVIMLMQKQKQKQKKTNFYTKLNIVKKEEKLNKSLKH